MVVCVQHVCLKWKVKPYLWKVKPLLRAITLIMREPTDEGWKLHQTEDKTITSKIILAIY